MPRLARRLFLFGIFFFGCVPLLADASKSVKLTILHTNDTHGHLLPYSYPDTFDPGSPLAMLTSRSNIGGAARRATLVKRIRAEKDRQTLLIDAGDYCDGTPFSVEYHGDADVAVMNAIGYDLACPGNHEFSNPLSQVRKMIRDAKFPQLCANVIDKTDSKPLYTPYVIRDLGGVKIAFFGLMTYDARTYPAAKNDLQIEPPIDAARRIVPDLRQKADLVVAVTHIGLEVDRDMAEKVPGIDVIISGHSHTLVPSPIWVDSTLPQSGPRRGTIIVQAFQWGGVLGRLDLEIEQADRGAWRVASHRGELLPITSTLPEDRAVAAVVSTYWEPIKSKYGEVIGQAAGDFAKKGSDEAEYHLMADAIREQNGWEFQIENVFGVRNQLAKGPITYGELASMDPFNNTIISFKATGLQLKAILQQHKPAVSGIRYRVANSRLTEATIDGKPIEDERIYSGGTNSYFAQFILKDMTDKTDTKQPRLTALIAYVRKHGVVAPRYDGRRVVTGPDRRR